ncbi:MAG TPA: HPF/RaiA family ribosome-associated protein [Polyangiaceae bacterium]|nr:HPF/RaiA family ribosome-associated protein [Polyangiaceae bacterium]
MRNPLQITFRDMPSSPALIAKIEARVEKLERICGRITSCRVVVQAPHRSQHKGGLFTITIELSCPGAEILASRDAGRNPAHEDAYVAVRDAFDAVERRLEDSIRRRREARVSRTVGA